MKGERLPSTEQFRNAKNPLARAMGWLTHIEASPDTENAKLRCDALLQLSLAADALGFELVPKLGEPVRG